MKKCKISCTQGKDLSNIKGKCNYTNVKEVCSKCLKNLNSNNSFETCPLSHVHNPAKGKTNVIKYNAVIDMNHQSRNCQ